MTPQKAIPVSDVDFYSDAVINDPYPVYEKLRELGPVVYLEKHNLYALPRYAEVSSVLRQPLRFASSRGVSPIQRVNDILVGSTLNSDPPAHDLTRSVTSEPLLPGSLKEIEPRIRDAAEGLIDTLCKRGEFDGVADFAQYLPVTIVAELVGLPTVAGVPQMLKWASATFNLFGTENERTEQAFEDLKDLRDFLAEYGQPDKLKPGGWARRIFEVGPQRGISHETCAQLMRDYINPSLDTTISTTGQMLKMFADSPDQWELLRKKPELMTNAIEEAVRLSTPIRSFTRYVTEESEIAGYIIPADERVLVIYASANRDERKYPNADTFDITRDVHDHVGFGQSVHMCMGMHLARLEIKALFEAFLPRVQRFEMAGNAEVAMNNTIRAWSKLPVRVHLDTNADSGVRRTTPSEVESDWLDAQVKSRKPAARDIIELELSLPDGTLLPGYDAGAHIDIQVRSGLVRQYSLTGDPSGTPETYRIGVLLDPKSRGGSAAIHRDFVEDRKIRIGRPRNNFPLDTKADHSILLAGGIGITPMLSMAYTLAKAGKGFELHYCGRTEDRIAFREELSAFGNKVHFHIDSGAPQQKLDIGKVLNDKAPGRHLYCCGPNGFMDFVVEAARQCGWNSNNIHLERFGAEVNTDGAPFTVEARKSGKTIEVQPGETIAEKLIAAGIEVQMSCQSGVCGTCLTKVIDGTPDHRDLVMTDTEKASNARVAVCCSRSQTRKLVLDT